MINALMQTTNQESYNISAYALLCYVATVYQMIHKGTHIVTP